MTVIQFAPKTPPGKRWITVRGMPVLIDEERRPKKAPQTKGGYAATGDTVTSIGRIGEKVATLLGLIPFREEVQTYHRPCDFRKDNTHAVEVKTFTTGNKRKKLRMTADAITRKQRFAKMLGLREMTVAIVLGPDLGFADVYDREGFGNFRLSGMNYKGRVEL